jgi:hypothetical protein
VRLIVARCEVTYAGRLKRVVHGLYHDEIPLPLAAPCAKS